MDARRALPLHFELLGMRARTYPVSTWANTYPLGRFVSVLLMLAAMACPLVLVAAHSPSVMWETAAAVLLAFGFGCASFYGFAVLVSRCVKVGTDGILIGRPSLLGNDVVAAGSRFVSYRVVTNVRHLPPSGGPCWKVALDLEDGTSVVLDTKPLDDGAVGDPTGKALADDARAAWQATREGGALREGEELLQRLNPRGLRRLSGESDFRRVRIARERLEEIVDSPAFSMSTRAAAAVALDAEGGRDGRERVRLAAEQLAAPEVRREAKGFAEANSQEEMARRLEALCNCEGLAP